MRYSAAGFALLLGCLATTPRLRAQAAEPTSRPAGVSYASVTASRAGFGPAAALAGALVPDTTATGCGSFRRRALHSVLGAGAGLVAGAIGAVVGWQMDRRDHGDAMIPASAALGVIGGAAGLVTGAVAGALVPCATPTRAALSRRLPRAFGCSGPPTAVLRRRARDPRAAP